MSRLPADVQRRLDRIMEKGLLVVIGDANGADRAVQAYFHRKGYAKVEVFCSGDHPRNNLGKWPLRKIPVPGRQSGLEFYTAKDRSMTDEASVGLMIWDGKSAGTLANASRLIEQGKAVAIYVAPVRAFHDVRTGEEWDSFTAAALPADRTRAAPRAVSKPVARPRLKQAALF